MQCELSFKFLFANQTFNKRKSFESWTSLKNSVTKRNLNQEKEKINKKKK